MSAEKLDFFHIWARQLQREHEAIRCRYRLDLATPVIEVVSAAGYVGKWAAATRTISLSRELLLEHPWDVVLNVLKHEMAHQLAAAEAGGGAGHGAAFKRACETLEIPPAFRKAAGRMPGSTPAEADRNSDSARVLLKVRKLLRLGDSTNRHESLLAIQKARQLMARHNLTGRNGQINDPSPYANLLLNLKRKRVESYHRAICAILLEYFQVEIVLTPLYDAHDLTTYTHIDLLGKECNVKIAGYVYHFLMEKLVSLWRLHQKSAPGRRNDKTSYWLGVLNGFREGLANDRQARTATNRPPGPTKENRLPAATDDQALRLFVAGRYPKLQSSRKRATRINPRHFEAGRQEGRLLQLRQGLENEATAQKLLAAAAPARI
jgi:hypothetical protein